MLPHHLAGPTASDLAEIDAEWPRIAADLAALDAQIRILTADHTLDDLAIRRARRATRAALATTLRRPAGGEAA